MTNLLTPEQLAEIDFDIEVFASNVSEDDDLRTLAIFRALRGHIAALQAERAWRPIETAPRGEDDVIDLWAVERGASWRVADAYWKKGAWWAPGQHWEGADGPIGATPTHWQPLPAAPSPPKETE